MNAIYKVSLLCVFLAFIEINTVNAAEPEVQSGDEYKIFTTTIPFQGKEVYVIKCNNGSYDDCNYNWQSLCLKGSAYNPDRDGNADESDHSAPSSFNRGRLFVCK